MKAEQVKTVAKLRKLAKKDGGEDFFIALNGGLRSSKHISYASDEKKFYVSNEIDGSEQTLTEKQLLNECYTNIGKAIKLGGFYRYV